MRLIWERKPCVGVDVAADAPAPLEYAREEIIRLLAAKTGCELPAGPVDGRAIVLRRAGDAEKFRKRFPADPVPESYVVDADEDNVYLIGADASGGVIFHARCALAIAARAAGVSAIDCVFLDVRDERAFREDAACGQRLGFEGKLCIHPTQVRIANEVYTPTAERVDYAPREDEGWNRALAEGSGVFSLEGRMIDAPLVALERRVLERARRAGALPELGERE